MNFDLLTDPKGKSVQDSERFTVGGPYLDFQKRGDSARPRDV